MKEKAFKSRTSSDDEYKFLKEITPVSFQSNKISNANDREVTRYQTSGYMCEVSQDMEKDCISDGSLVTGDKPDHAESKAKYFTPTHLKVRKRKSVRPSKVPWDEEALAFDADVDESSRSSIEQKLQTTFQSGTTLTWTSSSASSSAKYARSHASHLSLETPPRLRQGLDISSCSELSPLSYDGTMIGLIDSSSLSCSSESRDNCSPVEWYQLKRNRYPARRTNSYRIPSAMRKPVESLSLIVDEGIGQRQDAEVVKQKACLILRIKYVLWKLFFVIILYATFSFREIYKMISMNYTFNTNDISFSRNNFVVAKRDTRQQNKPGIQIQQSVGGLHFISDTPQFVEELGEIKRGFWGLGDIDFTFYENSTRHLASHRTRTSKPRVVFLNGVIDSSRRSKTLFEIDPTPFSDNTQLYGVLSSDDEALSKMEVLLSKEDGECVSEPWHKEYYPSCNSVHEFDFIHVDDQLNGAHLGLFEKQGYWRNAWRADLLLSDKNHEQETFIIKTPKYSHNFEHAHYEHDRVDALAMSRLTFSPHVVDIYAFCGRTVFTEYAGGPSLGSIFDKAKKHRFRKIEIARDLAIGLSHVHYGENGANEDDIHITHFDINPANIVVTDDHKLRINDFNIAQFVRRNITSGEQCSMPPHKYPNAQWRSPEEVNETRYLTAKADVFSLGHIFYRLICGHEPWNKFEVGGKPTSAAIAMKVKNGILPRMPEYVLSSKDPEIIAIRKAMIMCYTVEPNERPSSKAIAKFLEDELRRLRN